MRTFVKNSKGVFSTQKRFREWKPRAHTAIVQALRNPSQQDPGYHPNPSEEGWEKVGALQTYFQRVPLSSNTVFKFLQNHTYEDAKHFTDQQFDKLIVGDDIYQFAQALEPAIQQQVFSSFVRDCGPMLQHMDNQSDPLDTDDFREHLLEIPDDLKAELDISDADQKALLGTLDPNRRVKETEYRDIKGAVFDSMSKEDQLFIEEMEKAIESERTEESMPHFEGETFEDEEAEEAKAEEEVGEEIEDDDSGEGGPSRGGGGDEEDLKDDKIWDTWQLTDKDSYLTPENVLAHLKKTEGAQFTPEMEKETIRDLEVLFGETEGQLVQSFTRLQDVVDDEFTRDDPKLLPETTGVSSEMGDKMWQLHKQDPRLWTGERLGGLFGCDRDRAWGEICIRECHEAEQTGKPFNFDKLEYLFNRTAGGMTAHKEIFRFKTKYLTEEDAYKDFLKATEKPSSEGGDDSLPDWVALPFQPYRTLETEPDVKFFSQPPKLFDIGNEKVKTRMLFVDFGKRLLNEPRHMTVRELDGTLRTASWAEQKHFMKHGKFLSTLKVGRGMKKSSDAKRRKRLY
jgi:hypothetical protein